jgi:hypothetical protein
MSQNNPQKIFLSQLTKTFLEETMLCLKPYATVLMHFLPHDPHSVHQIGSGTFVRIGERFGVLTAYHVLHAVNPAVELGKSGNYILGLMASDRDMVYLPCQYLNEIPIATPLETEFGPDLTFIEIPTMPQLGTLKALKCFWDLNSAISRRETDVIPGERLLVTIGTPAESSSTTVSEMTTNISMALGGYFGGITSEDIQVRGEFDYVDTEIDYNVGPKLPRDFGGVSGGGLWSVSVSADRNASHLKIEDFFFCGVAFYQSGIERQKRVVRHHFTQSIYEYARKILSVS